MFRYILFVILLALAFLLYPYSDPKHGGQKKEFGPRDGEVFVNPQGLSLYTKKWDANGSLKAHIFLVHGLHEHSGRYLEVIHELNKEGYDVFTIDLQGHGKSEGDPGYVEEYQHFVDETIAWIESKLEKFTDKLPRFILGHSNGGLISTKVVLQKPQLVNGMILSAPLLYFSTEVANPTTVALVNFLSTYLPKLPLVPLDNTKLSKISAVYEKILQDEFHWKGNVKARMLRNMMAEANALANQFPNITVPFLVMHGTEDTLTNPEGSKMLYERAKSTDKTLKIYEGYYHELFNEQGREVVIKDVLDWLKKHTQ